MLDLYEYQKLQDFQQKYMQTAASSLLEKGILADSALLEEWILVLLLEVVLGSKKQIEELLYVRKKASSKPKVK